MFIIFNHYKVTTIFFITNNNYLSKNIGKRFYSNKPNKFIQSYTPILQMLYSWLRFIMMLLYLSQTELKILKIILLFLCDLIKLQECKEKNNPLNSYY